MVIFLGALQDIPEELLDAARIDGANAWQTFWRGRLSPSPSRFHPGHHDHAHRGDAGLQPDPHHHAGRAPATTRRRWVFYIFQEGFARFEQGMAAAIGVLLFLVIMVLTVLRFALVRGDKSLLLTRGVDRT